MESQESAASQPFLASQPETQEESSIGGGPSQSQMLPATQLSQPRHDPAPPTPSSQLKHNPSQYTQYTQPLGTQPPTQAAMAMSQQAELYSQCSGHWGEEGDDDDITRELITQAMSQAVGGEGPAGEYQDGGEQCELSGQGLGGGVAAGGAATANINDSGAGGEMLSSEVQCEEQPLDTQGASASSESAGNAAVPMQMDADDSNNAGSNEIPEQPYMGAAGGISTINAGDATLHQSEELIDDTTAGGAVEGGASASANTMVTNPYAKCKPTPGAKRSIDQISCRSSSNISASVAPSNASNNCTTPAAASRKQVYNPYDKSANQSAKQPVRNPYANMARPPSTNPRNPNNMSPMRSTTAGGMRNNVRVPGAAAATSPKPPSSSRRAGISISLPMADRLPSRNVSYRPAEILTVGELYRYLYDVGGTRSVGGGAMADTSVPAPALAELVSVRITGTLLCVATSHQDVNVPNSGTFLLVGDPLDKTRLLQRENPPPTATAAVTPALSKSANQGVTSILRHRGAPAESADASVDAGESEVTSNLKEPPTISDATPATAPANANASNNGTAGVTAKSGTKSATRGGILNTNKKRKLVYNKSGGKRLSFGGGLGGGKGIGGGLGRKFMTPKRTNNSSSVPSLLRRTKAGLSSTAKKGFRSRNSVSGSNNAKPEQIIQRHPSPLVPVWIGSSYSGDGLDGSVVSNSVMIMGEIVTERCSNCQESMVAGEGDIDKMDSDENEEASTADADNDTTSAQQPRTATMTVKDAAESIAACASRIASTASQNESSATLAKGRTSSCSQCARFLKARVVKNANGTDMSLQKEALKARRAYLTERRKQMESLLPTTGAASQPSLYSVGCGPPS